MDKPVKLCTLIKDRKNIECKNIKDNEELCEILHNLHEGCSTQYKKNNKNAKVAVIK
tara:strand:+ start:1319 stop:1489 length:171 start_codon:yes stop_codon:yes gene_type:complete